MIGKRIIKLGSVDSTNAYLAMQINQKAELNQGDVYTTHEQLNGKGHGVNLWESEPGKNLTFSIYLLPSFLKADEQFFLNMAVSLGVYDFVSGIVKDNTVKLKWPNDLYIGDKKVGGILISHSVSGSEILNTIVGIGINVNQLEFVSDAPNPASLVQYFGEKLNLTVCLHKLLKCMDSRYLQLESGSHDLIVSNYLSVLLGYGQWRNYIYKTKKIKAKIKDISKDGTLHLMDEYQKEIECGFKEIEFTF